MTDQQQTNRMRNSVNDIKLIAHILDQRASEIIEGPKNNNPTMLAYYGGQLDALSWVLAIINNLYPIEQNE